MVGAGCGATEVVVGKLGCRVLTVVRGSYARSGIREGAHHGCGSLDVAAEIAEEGRSAAGQGDGGCVFGGKEEEIRDLV